MSSPHSRYYLREEVARLLDASAADIRRLVSQGALSYVFVGGRHVIPANLVHGLVAGGTTTTAETSTTEALAETSIGEKGAEAVTVEATRHKVGYNPFVDHLNGYVTVSPEHASAFDEFSSKTPPPPGGRLEMDTRVEEFLKERFVGSRPSSVILTGNAGDGKTYLCRKIFEAFTKSETSAEWGEGSWVTVERDGLELRLVKDLSEIDEREGESVLRELQASSASDESDVVFLIAANEGRLRALLNRDGLEDLRRKTDAQLRGDLATEEDNLLVINLNRASTASYVARVLAWLAKPEQWQECRGCPAFEACPIRFNASRLAEERVGERLTVLYRLLEHMDVHVTVRDMLIHLAYMVTGGLSCEEVVRAHRDEPSHDLHTRAYYENCWGIHASPTDLRKLTVVHHLRTLDVGDYSLYEVDDFIINGDSADDEGPKREHDRLFAPAVDLKGEYFAQRRRAYLRGDAATSGPGGTQELIAMLPHCRRKLFFEWQDTEKADQLTPFVFLSDYLKLLAGYGNALNHAKSRLIVGLNRALTGLFVTDSNTLFVTSQYAHAVENPVPIVRVEVSAQNVALRAESDDPSWSEAGRRKLMLQIAGSWTSRPPVEERIDMLRFEYLMRLSQGGTFNVLAEECSLFVRELKDKLITSFGSLSEDNTLTFFGVENDRYVTKQLLFDEWGKLWT